MQFELIAGAQQMRKTNEFSVRRYLLHYSSIKRMDDYSTRLFLRLKLRAHKFVASMQMKKLR